MNAEPAYAIEPAGRSAREVVARRPAATAYVADTVADTFRISQLEVRAASVRGVQHRHDETPRQDAYAIDADDTHAFFAVAVADGVGSLPHSHLAAALAARIAAQQALAQVGTSLNGIDWAVVFGAAADAVVRRASRAIYHMRSSDGDGIAVDAAEAAAVMATTLTVAVGACQQAEAGWELATAWIGDSPAWILGRNGWRLATAAKSSDPATGIVVNDARALPVDVYDVRTSSNFLHAGEVLLVMSDGVGDPLGGGDGVVAAALGDWWRDPPDHHTFAAQTAFARQSFIDDRTCVGVWYPPVSGAAS